MHRFINFDKDLLRQVIGVVPIPQKAVTGIHHQVLVLLDQVFECLCIAAFDFANQRAVVH